MTRLRPRFLLLALCGLILTGCNSQPASQSRTNSKFKFKAGQVWNYTTRTHEPKSTFTVLKVEPDEKLGSVVHISIAGLKMKNHKAKSGFSDSIGHMPFSEGALGGSATKMVKEKGSLNDYQASYKQWKAAYEKGTAGAFSISVSEAVGVMEETLSNQK
jgi:hypothetical protein